MDKKGRRVFMKNVIYGILSTSLAGTKNVFALKRNRETVQVWPNEIYVYFSCKPHILEIKNLFLNYS